VREAVLDFEQPNPSESPEDSDYREAILEEEQAFREALLGAAFVLAQERITQVVSRLKRIHQLADGDGVTLNTTDGSKKGLLAKAPDLVAGSSLTSVEAINAMANYFKHHGEWPVDWQVAKGQTSDTIAVVKMLGITQGSTGGISTGLRSLGLNERSLEELSALTRNWQNHLHSEYSSELATRRLL
jgi:hypothetical protein